MEEKRKAASVFSFSLLIFVGLIISSEAYGFFGINSQTAESIINAVLASVALTSLWIAYEKFLSRREKNIEITLDKSYDQEIPTATLKIHNKGRNPVTITQINYRWLDITQEGYRFNDTLETPNKVSELGSPCEITLGGGNKIPLFRFGYIVVETPNSKQEVFDFPHNGHSGWGNLAQEGRIKDEHKNKIGNAWTRYIEFDHPTPFYFDENDLENNDESSFEQLMREKINRLN